MTKTITIPSDAEQLADAVLKAAGSGLRHYSLLKTRQNILAAAQHGIDKARAELPETVRDVIPVLQGMYPDFEETESYLRLKAVAEGRSA